MGIGGVSGQGKLRVWGRMLEGHCRRQEAFSILECLLGGNGALQRFGPPPPSGDQLTLERQTLKVAPIWLKFSALVPLSI
jgi:hypothetical protein